MWLGCPNRGSAVRSLWIGDSFGTNELLYGADRMALPDPLEMALAIDSTDQTTDRCASCQRVCHSASLQTVPWPLQLAAFPLTALFVLKAIFSLRILRHLWSLARSREVAVPEYFHRYCPTCLRRQVLCHWVVAIWAITFVGYWAYESLAK